ncbi:hypothetical protein [Flavobacterium sp.]
MTPSEKYVSELCQKSFLPFWSFPNPIGKKNKELCDILIVCENTIIIISVKDITVSNHIDESINYERWVKKAIHNSVEQIYGAERYLETVDEIFLSDRKTIIKLPPKSSRIIHRIAIAFGSKDEYPLPDGNFGQGYVSVFDEKSTAVILSELDTITDFSSYLIAKEKFVFNKRVLIPREVDFLAFYIQTGLEIPEETDVIASEQNLWDSYTETKDYLKWKDDILGSYIWDIMIWQLYYFHRNGFLDLERNEIEESIRIINLEPRMNRIVLGENLSSAIKNKVSARIIKPIENCNHSYVFMPVNGNEWNNETIIKGELILRCDVARYINSSAQKVIGIAIGNDNENNFRFNVCMIEIPEIDEDFINHVNQIQTELGYFKNIKLSEN